MQGSRRTTRVYTVNRAGILNIHWSLDLFDVFKECVYVCFTCISSVNIKKWCIQAHNLPECRGMESTSLNVEHYAYEYLLPVLTTS